MKIRCSTLETVRKNPVAYAELLATGDGIKGGGSHGMFACMQDVARLIHLGEVDVNQGIKELQKKFQKFSITSKNKAKQELLTDQLVKYCRLYEKQSFVFIDGWRNMCWGITADVSLTGRTPWVVSNGKGYYSFLLTEKPFAWSSELRFPLIQKYLVDNTIDCPITEMNVGIYCLATNSFDFLSFSNEEILEVVTETRDIFRRVYQEYKRKKP